MSASVSRRLRWSLTTTALGVVIGTFCVSSWWGSSASGQAYLSEPVIRVEEDWQLVLNEPNGDVDSPQLHTVMAPSDSMDASHAQVLWNYRETPGFVTGGVQLQSYSGETLLRRRSMEYGQLSTTAETITWTQSLTTDGVILAFEVNNGQSSSWGIFGKDMRIDDTAGLPDLNSYSSEVSARESGVTYGSNRVDLMVITEVRRYGASGLLSVDTVPKVVFALGE
jgi:hypothetical protein